MVSYPPHIPTARNLAMIENPPEGGRLFIFHECIYISALDDIRNIEYLNNANLRIHKHCDDYPEIMLDNH